jgi:hypothetical protein
MSDIDHRILGHVAVDAPIGFLRPQCWTRLAPSAGCVALEALPFEIVCPFLGIRNGVRIVARAAPQPLAGLDLATALGELLEVTGDFHFCPGVRPYEHGDMVGQESPRAKRTWNAIRFVDPDDAGKMALRTNAVAAIRGEFSRVNDREAAAGGALSDGSDMIFARPMATFATDSSFEKRIPGKAI